MELKNLKINFLGDSITEGHGASDASKCYVSLIGKNTGAICRNYGIGGSRIARKKAPSENPRYDLDFCSRVEEMDPDADIVVVFGGTNDYAHGDAPLGSFEDRTVWTFYGALHTLYTSLYERYPAARIVVLTPLHRSEEDYLDPPLKPFVDAIREVAEYYSLPLLDLYATAGLQPRIRSNRDRYVPDGLHPNDAGYEKLARQIQSFLERL